MRDHKENDAYFIYSYFYCISFHFSINETEYSYSRVLQIAIISIQNSDVFEIEIAQV